MVQMNRKSQTKLRALILASLIGVFLFFLIPSIAQENPPPSTSKTITLTNTQTIEGVNFARQGANFNISYKDKLIEFSAIPMRNNITYTWHQVKQDYPNSNFQIDYLVDENTIKFDLNFTNGAGMGVNLPNGSQLLLNLTRIEGVTLNDIQKSRSNIKFFGKLNLRFGNECELTFNKTAKTLLIENLSENCLDPTISLNSGNDTADVLLGSGNPRGFQIKFDTSNLGNTTSITSIDDGKLCLYITVCGTNGCADNDANVSRIANQTWDESILDTAQFAAMPQINQTQIYNWTSVTSASWSCINVTSQLQQSYLIGERNFTLRLGDVDNQLGSISTATDAGKLLFGKVGASLISFHFEDREGTGGTSNFPYLNVTYTATAGDTTPPTFTDISTNKSAIYHISQISVDFNATDDVAISSFQINYTEKFNISSNDGVLQNITSLGAGIYHINVSVNDTSNNFGFLIYTVEVNQTFSNVTVYIDGLTQNKSVYSGTNVWLNSTLVKGNGNVYLYRNQTLINNASTSPAVNLTNFTSLGIHNITGYYFGNENYSENWSYSFYVNVTQYLDTIPPTFTNILENLSYIYGAGNVDRDFNATDTESAISSYQVNYTEKFNITTAGWLQNKTALGTGIYNINISVNDTSGNYGFILFSVEVNQSGATNITLYLNNLTQNLSITSGQKAWINATLINSGFGYINLYNNGTKINNASYSVSNYTNFTNLGEYNITGFFEGNENYTSNWSRYVFYVKVNESTNPLINITFPINNSGFSTANNIILNYTVSDDYLQSCWYFAFDSSLSYNILNTTITCGQNTSINFTKYDTFDIFVYVNDTTGNINYSLSRIVLTSPVYTDNPSGPIIYSGYNETKICFKIYDFIVNHTDSIGIKYTQTDLLMLRNRLQDLIGIDMTAESVERYIINFNTRCSNLTGLTKPSQLMINENNYSSSILNIDNQCDKDIRNDIKPLGVPFDLSIPIPIIYIGNPSCGSINVFKWILRYTEINERLAINGVRIVPLIFIIIIGSFVIFMVKRRKINLQS